MIEPLALKSDLGRSSTGVSMVIIKTMQKEEKSDKFRVGGGGGKERLGGLWSRVIEVRRIFVSLSEQPGYPPACRCRDPGRSERPRHHTEL